MVCSETAADMDMIVERRGEELKQVHKSFLFLYMAAWLLGSYHFVGM